MKIKEKYQIIGKEIMDNYFMHGKKEVVVTFTDSPVLESLSVSVGAHFTVGFSERETKIKKL